MQGGEDLGTDTPFVMLLSVAVLPAAVVSSGPPYLPIDGSNVADLHREGFGFFFASTFLLKG